MNVSVSSPATIMSSNNWDLFFSLQSDWSNLKKTATQRASKDSTSTPSVSSPSVRSSPARRWAPFLSSGSQVGGGEARAAGLSQSSFVSDGSSQFHRHSLPVVSMFDTGEDFDVFPTGH